MYLFTSKFYNNCSRKRGGLALYILDTYCCQVRSDLVYQEGSIESLFVEVDSNCIVGIVYRRPNTNPRDFLVKFHNILDKIKTEKKRCYIMGDINLDLLKWDTNAVVSDLIAICSSKMFFNTITKPTRVTANSATLIDHIWSNDILHNLKNGILFTRISDHFPTYAVYGCDDKRDDRDDGNGRSIVKYRKFSEENISQFRGCLQDVCWNLVYTSHDPNVCFRMFLLIFCACFNKCFPIETKLLKTKSLTKPYITNEIKALIAEKNKLQRKYAKRPITYGEAYRTLRNRVTQMIRVAKGNYFKKKLEDHSNNLKKYWGVINDILNRKNKVNSNNSRFKVNDEFIYDSESIVKSSMNILLGSGRVLLSSVHHGGLISVGTLETGY